MRLFLRWIINTAALLVVPYIITSIQIDGVGRALVAALVLGILNALIRPLLILLTLPVTILSLGLFMLVINGLMFWFAAYLLEGFSVGGFWSAFFGALVYSLITWVVNAFLLPDRTPR